MVKQYSRTQYGRGEERRGERREERGERREERGEEFQYLVC